MGKYTFPATLDEDTAEFIYKYILDEFRHIFDINMIGLTFSMQKAGIPNVIYENEEFSITVETNDKVTDELLKEYVTYVIVDGFHKLYLKHYGREWDG